MCFHCTYLLYAERPLDILPLAHFFISQYAAGLHEIDAEAANKLTQYAWPGNVRELENVMQRALILRPKGPIQAEDIVVEDDFYHQHAAEQAQEAPPEREYTSNIE